MVTQLVRCTIALSLLLSVQASEGQVFTGTNPPGAATTFSVSIGSAATNVSFTVPGSGSAYSYVLVRAGSPPTDISYDYISHLQGNTNAINLEQPEAVATNYYVRVRTPSTSLAHAFTLMVETNRPGFRTAARPVAKPLGCLTGGAMMYLQKEYFHVEVPSNTLWRVAASATNSVPNLYVRDGQLPTETAFLKASENKTNDVIAFLGNETAGGTYYVGAFAALPGTFRSRYSLRIESVNSAVLNWDPGLTHEGTLAYTNLDGLAADYYFKITTANPDVGGWRTALNVRAGDANLYLKRGGLPGPEDYHFKSDRPGSDGFVLKYGTQFNPSEDWYILVRAGAGAQWSLVSGTPYVQDLGVVAADGSGGSGDVNVGGEGARFFRTVIPNDMLAWRLWLVGTNLFTNAISLKQTGVPTTDAQLSGAGRMLVVPPVLANNIQYFVRVDGLPGSTIRLDSRHQPIVDLPFNASITNEVAGFGYATYRIVAPIAEIAWQLTLPSLSGNPNLALRKSLVPNESYNSALSEQAGSTVDNITLVPDTFSDGTYYLTVYSTNDFRFQYGLQSGPPAITEIDFTSATTNPDTHRVGWRFFRLTDLSQQAGKLGWDLYLTNEAPGTRLALRSSKCPGTWPYRDPAARTASFYDVLSTGNYLQRPAQQAGTWYVGVYNPSNALGAFTLVTGELTPSPITNGQLVLRSNVPPARWDYYSLVVPAGVLGWDVRLTNVTSGQPKLYVRRGALPDVAAPNLDLNSTSWTIGLQVAAANDWTKRTYAADGTDETGRIIVTGMGRPLEPGTYYVGVLSGAASTNASYGLISRWIGPSEAVPVVDLPPSGIAITNTLPPREAAYYRVVLPSGLRSWKVRLQTAEGEAMLVVSTNWIPHVNSEKRVQKAGHEHYTRLPLGATTALEAGTNYLVVVSEGTNPPAVNATGSGASTYILELKGELPELSLGTLATTDLFLDGTLEGGEIAAYHFNSSPGLIGFKIHLESTEGTALGVSRCGPELAGLAAPYGNEGGASDGADFTTLLLVSDPCPDETVMVQASAGDLNTSYRLRLSPILPEPLPFDGSPLVKATANGVEGDYYFVDVPPGAEGWDLRLVNVTNGFPRMVVRRDYLGISWATTGLNLLTGTNWPSLASWAADLDWTERPLSAAGVDERGRVLAMGMNRPLQPGRYYITVFGADSSPLAYTLQSRGIGTGFSLQVSTNLAFAGSSITVTGLPPREAAYFRVEIPTHVTSWKVRLTGTNETALIVERGALPNVKAQAAQLALGPSAGKKMQKLGDEYFLLLPPNGSNYLAAGTYYLAVVSEGSGATATNRVGAGTVNFTLSSQGQAPLVDLGQLSSTNLSLLNTQSLGGGDTVLCRFTALPEITSLDAKLENPTGYPVMVLTGQGTPPYPGATISGIPEDVYGNEGGIASGVWISTNTITLGSVTNSTFLVAVKARAVSGLFTNAAFTLRVTGRVGGAQPQPLAFDGGAWLETNLTAAAWRFYQVDVPTNALGWDLRVLDGGTNALTLVVRRDSQPTQAKTTPWSSPGTATSWPSDSHWAAGADWTRRTLSPLGTNESGRVLAMGMGLPLEPGTYFVGVTNTSRTNAVAYTILSRGIGAGMAIPVVDLPFVGSVTNLNLTPREAAYYRVEVPTNAPNWKVRLTTLSGECMMAVLRARVPNVDSIKIDGVVNSGKGMQRLGNDHFILLPPAGQTNIQSGTYYIAVVSEGLNPASSTKIGTDSSSYVIESLGPVTPSALGFLTSLDLVTTDILEGGEVKTYQFIVPPGMLALKARLDNRVANPSLVLRSGSAIPDPGAATGGLAKDNYGNEGGEIAGLVGHSNVVTIINPAPGFYTIAAKARTLGTSGGSPLYPDASYTLRLQEVLVPVINFSGELNTNGLPNVVTGLLENNERAFFKVQVPVSIHGVPVVGWKLALSQSSGLATMRVGRERLPDDASANLFPLFTDSSAIIVPPFLTNGTWYVEVCGSNLTAFTLTSSILQIERPAWALPSPGDTNVAPGLQWPVFGDSGMDTNGTAVSGDSGTVIGQGTWHYYAVDVPDSNSGLLRCQLDALSGDPDLYVRAAFPPTLSHSINGVNGSTYDRLMTGSGNAIANWVPLDGKLESALQPGRWYLAVRAAGGINARYRLRLSVGNFTDVPLHGPPIVNQFVQSNDWSYYRIRVPGEVPVSFNLGYSLTSGSINVYLRDTLPPGNGTTVGDFRHWATDNKNNGPYPSFSSPGTYTSATPPLRPGSVYYVGVRGTRDAIFDLTLTTNGLAASEPKAIDFYAGVEIATLPPYSQALYRIPVPPEATRWIHTSLHSTNVQFFLEQGTLPAKGSSDDWRSSGANASNNKPLVTWNDSQKQYLPAAWPWVAGQSYYLIVSNNSAGPEDFEFRMNGRNPATDDSDLDQLPDAWELYYFGNLTKATASVDSDNDGVSNLDEFLEGTNPADSASFQPRLSLAAFRGSILAQPGLPSYPLGTEVLLTPVPDPGYSFVRWLGDAQGRSQPLHLIMDAHKVIQAEFKLSGDDFVTALPIAGTAATRTASNVGYTKEPGEPYHAGNPGGKSIWWTWTPPLSGPVTFSTAGSAFTTLLAAYTGSSVSNLTWVASDLNSLGGTNRSRITFNASSNTTYYLAVDGLNAASSWITLSMSMNVAPPTSLTLDGLEVAGTTALLRVHGPPNATIVIDASTNLIHWTPILTNTAGNDGGADFADPNASHPARFYRGRVTSP